MKNKIILLLLIILFIPSVKAHSYLSSNNTKTDNIIDYKEGIIKTTNNTVSSYQDNILISQKTFLELNNINIIKYNDNFLLVGIKNNNLKIILLDKYLKIINQKETSYIINQTVPSLYSYNDKIYILFKNQGILTTNNIYIVDDKLNIEEKRLSDIKDLKSILKSDYNIIKMSGTINNEGKEFYNSSTYENDNVFIVGYIEDNLGNKNAIITSQDKEGYTVWKDNNKDYIEFNDVTILENKIFVLANNGYYTYLLTYDFNGNKLSTEKIADTLSSKFIKVKNQLYILNDNSEIIYNYEIKINIESNIYGNTTYTGDSIPYNEITLSSIANSGYKIKEYQVKDEQGNIINLNNNSFIMPNNSVTVSTIYEETVINPDTVDMIFVVFAACTIALIILVRTYKEYKWLRG